MSSLANSRVELYDSDSEQKVTVNAEGELAVYSGGHVSTVNSTTATLAGDAVFTGTSEEIKDVAVIMVHIKASHASATDGLSVQWSPDGTNWDGSDDFTIPAASGKTYSFQPAARYFRIVYTNGSTDQTYFRLQTIFKHTNTKPSSHRIADAIIDDDDAELVTNVNKAENPSGTFVNIGATPSGNLRVTDAESGLAIARGDVTATSFIHKFGAAPDFDTSDGEVTVWDGAEDNVAWENMVYDYSSTAIIDSLSSSNAGDTVDVEIQGLDSNFDVVTQTLTLNGQNRVALTTDLIRVFRVKNVGSTNLAGHVFVFENDTLTGGVPDDASLIRAVVQPENNQTEMAVYTIPNGHTGYMRSWYATTAGASKSSQYIIRLKARPTGQVFQLKHKSSLQDGGTSYIHHKYVEPEVFAAKTDLEMTVEATESGATGAVIAAGFDIVLVQD